MAAQPQQLSLKLNTGAQMPMVGLGTWKSTEGEVGSAVKAAVKAGYRHIDCAACYLNEAEVGKALKELFEEGVVKREDLFITSKLWNTEHGKENVLPALKQTLSDLGLEYLDLYLIHWTTSFKKGEGLFPLDDQGYVIASDPVVAFEDTWAGMEEVHAKGLARAIGLSNFNRRQIEDVLKVAKVVPAQLQIESHPYFPNTKLIEFAQSKGIQCTAYSPLGSFDRPFKQESDPILIQDPALQAVADKIGKTPAQVLIRYQIERGVVVIPKSVRDARIKENFEVFDFKLDEEDMASLTKLDKGPEGRTCDPKMLKDGKVVVMVSKHPHYAFSDEY